MKKNKALESLSRKRDIEAAVDAARRAIENITPAIPVEVRAAIVEAPFLREVIGTIVDRQREAFEEGIRSNLDALEGVMRMTAASGADAAGHVGRFVDTFKTIAIESLEEARKAWAEG